MVAGKRRPDGLWRAEGYYWRRASSTGATRDVVDWGRAVPNEFVTLNALRGARGAESAQIPPSSNDDVEEGRSKP
jgi:hypothetical protein